MSELIHTNTLRPSLPDDISLCDAVQSRLLSLCEAHFRIRGVQLVPPVELATDMVYWRQMAVRHKKGDFRHSADELMSLKRVAQWTVSVNSWLRNQPDKTVEWEH